MEGRMEFIGKVPFSLFMTWRLPFAGWSREQGHYIDWDSVYYWDLTDQITKPNQI